MRKLPVIALGLVATTCLFAACSSEKDKDAKAPATAEAKSSAAAGDAPLTVERSAKVWVTAKVKAVNQTTREVTLQDAAGHSLSFVAGPEVQRLNEVRVGDNVTAEYVVGLVAELRPATAEERGSPIAAVVYAGRSPKGTEPAAGAAGGVRVVTTVQAVDLGKMMVTLKGPMGDTTAVRARSTENIKKLRVGDTVVLTYVEAIAVSLVKANK